MSLTTNFSGNPYYDDYSDSKKFLRLLFKPGYAVQARELTQVQSSLQNQIGKFGDHVFKNGSVVKGGEFVLQKATYLKLSPTYNSVAVDITNFVDKTIFSNDGTKRAQIIKVYAATATDPITFMVKQIYGDDFIVSDVIKTSETTGDGPFFATVSGVGIGQIFSVGSGVFYYDGFFISNDTQTVATSKYSANTATAKIGFEIVESIITAGSDTTLLDPAQDASNYQAPGSDRYKIDLVLSTRSLESEDTEKFIELMQVKNGDVISQNKYPIYAVIADTLARRTYDESGNYTTKAFTISLEDNSANTAQTNIILSPGKAYVYGYEFETISPTTLTVDKPRTTGSVNNKRLPVEHGNYVYTTNHVGAFPINDLAVVDIHCVNVASAAISNNTKIGTTRIKSIFFDYATNNSDSNTYNYQTFIFDTAINSITGTIGGASSNVLLLSGMSNIVNAYQGAKLRITSGPGSDEPAKTITSYSNTRFAAVTPAFITTPNTSSTFSIDFEFKDGESFHYPTTNAAANFAEKTKDQSKPYKDALVFESTLEPIINKLGEEYIALGSITDLSFSYKKLYSGLSFNNGLSPNLSIVDGSEELADAGNITSRQQNYYISVVSQGTSPYPVGSIIPSDKFTVSSGKITVVSGNNMTATVIATVDSGKNTGGAQAKVKTYVAANSEVQVYSDPNIHYKIFSNDSFVSFPSKGQAQIDKTFVITTPGIAQSLYVSDVDSIEEIIDFNNYDISTANLDTTTVVTDKYIFDNGQRDSYYDHASIILKPGVIPPKGPLLVRYNKFTCDQTDPGFFTVDSYSGIDYDFIPNYKSTKTNVNYLLRDCLDFRIMRRDGTNGSGNGISFITGSPSTGSKIPEYSSDIVLDYDYYLPRIDKVVLDKTQVFNVVQGSPSLNPVTPNDTQTGMTLFVLNYPPYTAKSASINSRMIDHRRYTMRDIGAIDKRLKNVEYYTTLSLLEKETLSKQDLTTLDTNGQNRFKNGIIVDSFKGQSIGDVTAGDFIAAIDPINKELRPTFNISAHRLEFDPDNSSHYSQTGSLISLPYTNSVLIDQNKSTKITNVNPFNIVTFLGKVKLFPDSDIWTDTITKPSVLVNNEGDRDAWELLSQNSIKYEWGAWNTVWTGIDADVDVDIDTRLIGSSSTTEEIRPDRGPRVGMVGTQTTETRTFSTQTTTTTTTTTTQAQTRRGIMSKIIPTRMVRSLGTKVVDVSIIPYMRAIDILFVGTDFKPNREIYPYFENAFVGKHISNRVNKFVLANNNLQFAINYSGPKPVSIKNTTTNTIVGSGIIVHSSNNIVYVSNIVANNSFNETDNQYEITGTSTENSPITYNTISYEHAGGNFSNVSSTSTVFLSLDGKYSSVNFVGKTIYIIKGPGAGESANIESYTAATGQITVSPAFTTLPTTSSEYGIGGLKTDLSGSLVGLFSVPGGQFLVGEKLLRFMDNQFGDLTSSSTSGDARFYAQGQIQTVQETMLSTTVPITQRVFVNDGRVITDTNVKKEVNNRVNTESNINISGPWNEPIAETFLVNPVQYPSGIYLTKVRFCFKTKDETIPVTLQLRPSVNGYPSSSIVYPYSTVTVTPDKVNITDVPDLDDSTKYTEFVFDSPIYLQPGEHAFVMLANTNKYETYLAEIGKIDLRTGSQISEQPYGGTFFASQTSTTWTADQSSDLMFRMFRAEFDTSSTSAIQFLVDPPEESFEYNLFQFINSEIVLPETAINHYYLPELVIGSISSPEPIIPGKDYELDDSLGMRIINTDTGNTSFILGSYLSSSSSAVSPILDSTRSGILTVGNNINDLGLANTGFVIEHGGDNYINTQSVSVEISGGGGSGAVAYANVVGGIIDAIYLTDTGSGYYYSPTVTITAAVGANAVISYNGETEKSGGNALARYLCRRVTLADGFDSGDLRVYITAYKPYGTNIYAYYKVLSNSDNEQFENKKWQLLTQIGNANYVSLNKQDYRELVFAPGINGVADNAISYTNDSGSAFNSFITFAIKLVMTSQSENIVPKIRDFRAIALPTG